MSDILTRYLERIGHRHAAPTEAELAALVTKQLAAIPFENLDPLCGVGVADLSPDALADKIVDRKRGGFCYELNGLFRYVLDQLGYDVVGYSGRVVWGDTTGIAPPRTHYVLQVTVPDTGRMFLVDVGFGTHTPPAPMLFENDSIVQTPHADYHLVEADDELTLNMQRSSGDKPIYYFDRVVPEEIDLQVGSWYASTYPGFPFVGTIVAGIVTPTAKWALGGRTLNEYRPGEPVRRTELGSAADVVRVLTETFDIDTARIPGLTEHVEAALERL
ncbi:arylamine N-acetyltransferase family protein [Antrihabitans stalactiti]|uniref:Arylamine N-acetyltransferase n=1 Tax=Antrihabitans stalactiti TaxID=2584121 RepID=A0A848KMR7_9NOCA|nr:arylamine N-acetyltransferase [Antrihabitans stalactiti]NMN98254.1 arylamine N-acetyltransferase [Antrihabitans stalactiti]